VRRTRLFLAAIAALSFPSGGAWGLIHDPVVDPVPCDYGEARPRLPSGSESRAELYDLFLGQSLRPPERREILVSLKARYPGEATDAFVAIAEAQPYDSEESILTFESIVRRLGGSADPDVQVEVARARWMQVQAWSSRHVGEGEAEYLEVHETYRRTAQGRRWSKLLDAFIRDYRGRGPAFEEFVAAAEYDALFREMGDLTPGEHLVDGRLLDEGVARIRDTMRARMRALIARYEASPNDRVQRVVFQARDMLAPYELGRAALIPVDRDLIARYRGARDIELRAEVDGAYHRLKMSLAEARQERELAALEAEHSAWKAANYDKGCAETLSPAR
jgi:hypothetical protein